MKTILLAAGLGTRLRPMTNHIPKCLVPIKGKPLLQIWLENLTNAGLNSFLINTHYLSNQVEAFIRTSKFKEMCEVKYEENLLGTAGTLLSNIDFTNNEDCLLIHADNYCHADFNLFIKAHKNRPKHCLLTMMTFQTDNPSSCGIVELDKQNVVIGFHEKVNTYHGNIANGAVYLLSPEFLIIMKNDFFQKRDFSTEVLGRFIGQIYTFETKDIFLDIGTPEMFEKANQN
jgi:mannose-1-phosphate guanylyltransferase